MKDVIYIPVSVSEELPKTNDLYFVLAEVGGAIINLMYSFDTGIKQFVGVPKHAKIMHWLKPIEVCEELSDEEIYKIALSLFPYNGDTKTEVDNIPRRNNIAEGLKRGRSFYSPKLATIKLNEGRFAEWLDTQKSVWSYIPEKKYWVEIAEPCSIKTTAELLEIYKNDCK